MFRLFGLAIELKRAKREADPGHISSLAGKDSKPAKEAYCYQAETWCDKQPPAI